MCHVNNITEINAIKKLLEDPNSENVIEASKIAGNLSIPEISGNDRAILDSLKDEISAAFFKNLGNTNKFSHFPEFFVYNLRKNSLEVIILNKLKCGETITDKDYQTLQKRKILNTVIANKTKEISARKLAEDWHKNQQPWMLAKAIKRFRLSENFAEGIRLIERCNNFEFATKSRRLKYSLNILSAKLFRDAGKLVKARHYAERAYDLLPNETCSHLVLGTIANCEGDNSNGREWYEKAIYGGCSMRDYRKELESTERYKNLFQQQ